MEDSRWQEDSRFTMGGNGNGECFCAREAEREEREQRSELSEGAERAERS